MVASHSKITLDLARGLAKDQRRVWTEFHLDSRARVVWFVRDHINLGVNFNDGTLTVEFCTKARLKKRVKLVRCDVQYLKRMFEDPFLYARREVWCDIGRRTINKDGMSRMMASSGRLRIGKIVREEIMNDPDKFALRAMRFGGVGGGSDDAEKIMMRRKRFGGIVNDGMNENGLITDSVRSSASSVGTETVVNRMRQLAISEKTGDSDNNTNTTVNNNNNFYRNHRTHDVIGRERRSAAEKGTNIYVYGSRNLKSFVSQFSPTNVELLTISADGLGALYYCVESGEYIWQDEHRISFGIAMLRLLNCKVRERASCLSVGVNKRYFLQRSDGEAWYRGPELLGEVVNSGAKVKCVAFGNCYDSVVILCFDGRIMRSDQIPNDLKQVLDSSTEQIQLVSMGPNGEWFVRMESDHYLFGGVSEEMKINLDKCAPKLKEVTFGSKAFIARYG